MCEIELCKKCGINPSKKGELQICEQCWFHCNHAKKDMSIYKRDFTTICLICHNQFKKNVWNQKVCSIKCQDYLGNHIYNSIEFTCKQCGNKFKRPSRQNRKRQETYYCSAECNAKGLGKQTSAAMRTNKRYGNYYCKGIINKKEYHFRSGWELKTAVYLENQGLTWSFEPITFETDEGGYIPDFYVKEWDLYLEIKGERFREGIKKFNYCKQKEPDRFILWGKKELQERGILTCKVKPIYVNNTSSPRESHSQNQNPLTANT
jgi:hypothetical protein